MMEEIKELKDNLLFDENCPPTSLTCTHHSTLIPDCLICQLHNRYISISSLRLCALRGIPLELARDVWGVCLGVLPPLRSKWPNVRNRQRKAYWTLVETLFHPITERGWKKLNPKSGPLDQFDQIQKDVQRTAMAECSELFSCDVMRFALCRIAFVWSHIRPKFGYFQVRILIVRQHTLHTHTHHIHITYTSHTHHIHITYTSQTTKYNIPSPTLYISKLIHS
jgi:hypothetical protein